MINRSPKIPNNDDLDKATASIDSLCLRFPLNSVKIVDQSILAKKYVVNADTGDIERELKAKAKEVWGVGYKTRYAIQEQRVGRGVGTETFIVIQFNSKLLEGRYFEGITHGNIRVVYEKLMQHGIMAISYDDFMRGECTDTDFKRDLNNDDFSTTISILVKSARPSKQLGQGYKAWRSKTNQGIQFASRQSATYSNPFLKFYHKGIQLISESLEFYEAFLQEHGYPEHKVRIETTIKNKKHFDKLGISDRTLQGLLSLTDSEIDQVFRTAIKKHLEPRTMMPSVTDNLTPSDSVFVYSIEVALNSGISFENYLDGATHNIENRSSKHNTKKRLTDLYLAYVKGTDLDNLVATQTEFCKAIGWE